MITPKDWKEGWRSGHEAMNGNYEPLKVAGYEKVEASVEREYPFTEIGVDETGYYTKTGDGPKVYKR